MKAHGETDIALRSQAQDDIRQEIQGKQPVGAFEYAEDLTFDSIKPDEERPKDLTGALQYRLKQAVYRDSRYASAGGVYLRAFGLSNALREIYDGSKQLVDAGAR